MLYLKGGREVMRVGGEEWEERGRTESEGERRGGGSTYVGRN